MRERATALGGKEPRGSAAQTDEREELRVTEAGNGATSTNGRCRRRSERGTDAATKRERGNLGEYRIGGFRMISRLDRAKIVASIGRVLRGDIRIR